MSADNNIVERLVRRENGCYDGETEALLREAAAEIVRLRGEVDCSAPLPKTREEAVALAREVLRHLGIIDRLLDEAIARCEESTIAPAEAKGDWQYESMRFLAYGLRQMSAISFDADTCADAASWLEKFSRTPQPADGGAVAVGPLDLSAPPRVFLQVDTDGDDDDRSEAIPREAWGDLTWHHERIGGQEVEYIRADLANATHPAAGDKVRVTEEMFDNGLAALLAFRKSGDDWTGKPAHAVRAVLEAALQHRGDSRGGEADGASVSRKKHDGPCWRNSHADCGC